MKLFIVMTVQVIHLSFIFRTFSHDRILQQIQEKRVTSFMLGHLIPWERDSVSIGQEAGWSQNRSGLEMQTEVPAFADNKMLSCLL